MDVTIDELVIVPPSELETWGEILEWVETKKLKPGNCITRVTIQGQEEIEYRQPSLCGRVLQEVGPVNIESGEFSTVVQETFAELQSEIELALKNTRDIITLFENRSEERAHAQLGQLLESIRLFFQVFSEDLGWVNAPDNTKVLDFAIRQLIAAQENRFWVAICDVLEYEITPILESWRTAVVSTRASAH
jgi:hypothetical protein